MLSRALQKANTAVLLDNAQNFEGAIEAYGDACKLLQEVMDRSSGDEDKRKLDAIRVTYTARMEELRQLDPLYEPSPVEKVLPARPMSDESLGAELRSYPSNADQVHDELDAAEKETAAASVDVADHESGSQPAASSRLDRIPVRDSLPSASREAEAPPSRGELSFLRPLWERSRSPNWETSVEWGVEVPMNTHYMPPPLSPRPLASLSPPEDEISTHQNPESRQEESSQQHSRVNSNEASVSWLDTIDESGSSCTSDIGSTSSHDGLHIATRDGVHRKHLRTTSGETQAEFDNALDAAIEAAYDANMDFYEEEDASVPSVSTATTAGDINGVPRNHDDAWADDIHWLEREHRIREAKERARQQLLQRERHYESRMDGKNDDQTSEAADEERMLDDITQDYILNGFNFDLQSKSALPRQSDSSSSGYSRSTWESSSNSHRTTAGTSLSTVAEHPLLASRVSQQPTKLLPPISVPSDLLPLALGPARHPPPTGALPTPPSIAVAPSTNVRGRRLSGQNPKQLKIETAMSPPPGVRASMTASAPKALPSLPKEDTARGMLEPHRMLEPTSAITGTTAPEDVFKVPGAPASQGNSLSVSQPTSAVNGPSTASTVAPATPGLTLGASQDSIIPPISRSDSPHDPQSRFRPQIRKNKSSLSLRNKTMSISSPEGSDMSLSAGAGTPMSSTFSTFQARRAPLTSVGMQPAATPAMSTFAIDGLAVGGMYLFESDIHSPTTPGSPNPLATNAPVPLEPCPEAYLLRPFWLMRALYQTIAHPRGGYLSTKLFVPRDIWRVKGVKIKAVDEKTSACDLLTAALLKVGSVDDKDADAVLEELQSFEHVMDQVQINLNRKLGSEVGAQGLSSLFRDSGSTTTDSSQQGTEAPAQKPTTTSHTKSYLSSWRRLRSKSSGVGLGSLSAGKDVSKEALTMPSLPMTSLPTVHFVKREARNIVCEGPHANYMSALARLFDAVQVLDDIARSVEDPGLKTSSPTYVGLELTIRHAAEFFAFFICRFVLADVTMLLDKFIKRGSEWVLL
ncbi:hypothetical protein B0A49_07892 [Cryomyces minteri]|uniref:MIT domain-containing protein n=2 Tax=Cryomyces minteri TaxID=331657 RepID=A0A4U0XFP1_9PEZI|nr:hypothetical protein B0A49_07892 [Cryomyces minteri]